MDLRELLSDIINKNTLSKAILSNKVTKDKSISDKVIIKPVEIKGEVYYQFETFVDNKAIHNNLEGILALEELISLIKESYKQGIFKTAEGEYQVLVSKKGKIKIISNKGQTSEIELSHNRPKKYILNEGEPVDFLMHLGVMSKEGKVFKQKYNKFKQINRFLELVEASLDTIIDEEEINIIDFGCGKSYLTFALYYYLVKIKGKKVKITGLDLKKDVIDFCNITTEELGYDNLEFVCGDIKDHFTDENIHMVVTLHACDNATDIALEKAVRWGAKVILSVPCCQHELYDKINNNNLKGMLKHGIIREKLSSLVTDSIRGNVLEILGYQVQLVEFIDMEHTPKNIMIRAIQKHPKYRADKIKEYNDLKNIWGLDNLFIEEIMEDILRFD